MITLSHEEFDNIRTNLDGVAEGSETGEFSFDHYFADGPLRGIVEPGENENVRHASNELGPELIPHPHQYRALNGSERRRFHSHCFSRTNVARKDDVESPQVESFAGRERDPGVLNHLEEYVENERVGFFDFIE